MKEGIHPNYQPTTIKCACGEVIETRSTKQDIKVEIYNVTLVGSDSKNYRVEVDCEVSADIIGSETNASVTRKTEKLSGSKIDEERRQEIA